MLNRFCFTVLFVSFFTFSTAYAEDDIRPGLIVEETVNQVLQVLIDDDVTCAEKRSRTYELVSAQVNFSGMSRRILAMNWNKSSDEQKQQFEILFRQILLNTYWQRIKNYNGEKVEYITGMIDGNRFATVDTVILSDKIEIPVTYRMEIVDGKWMAYDFLIESLSLVTRYRTEYRNIIKTHGVDGLLKQMQDKLDPKTD
jgi:phospholipid transport system substrate-binding protein